MNGVVGVVPANLVEDVVASALLRRRSGRAMGAWAAEPASGDASYLATVEELDALLARLQPADWERPADTARVGWAVRDVVAHLVAIEWYQASLLRGEAYAGLAGVEHDHVAVSAPTVAALAGQSGSTLRALWAEGVAENRRLLNAAGYVANQAVAFHGLAMTASAMLLIRTFELWTHAEDIARAVGLQAVVPHGPRLAAMGALAVHSLPLGWMLAGETAAPAPPDGTGGLTVRIVLTGPGGGAWSVALDGSRQVADQPDALVVADIVDFCRLAAQRIAPQDLECVIEGDESLAMRVLVTAGMFAA